MAAADPERVKKILDKVAGEVVGVVQLRAYQAIAIATPVDTGFARSTITPTIGTPATGFLDRPSTTKTRETKRVGLLEYKPASGLSKVKAEARARRAENLARSKNIADTYQLSMGKVFIVALASYFVHLNAGSSAQAAAMFVERAVEKAVLSLRNFRPRSA